MPGGRRCGWRDCSLELYGARTDGESEAVARAKERSLASYAHDSESVVSRRIPARSVMRPIIAVAAALISEADQSMTLRGSTICSGGREPHSTATTKITFYRPMRNLQAVLLPRALVGSIACERCWLLGRLASRLPLHPFHGHVQVANQCDHSSRQFRDP